MFTEHILSSGTQELEAANADLDRALHVALAVHQEDAHARSQLQV